jgi:hypothetical protein
MAGEVLKFPKGESGGSKERELAFNLRGPQKLEKFELGQSQDLLFVAQRVTSGCKALLEFIDLNRDLSRKAGIETIAIELSTSLEGEGFERIMDALEEASAEGKPVHLSMDGLARLRRMEALLAEASSNINRFTQGGHRLAEVAQARAARESERRRLEIQLAERRLDALREKYRTQDYASHREADILAGIDSLNDIELAQGTPPAPIETKGSSNALLWGSLIAFGAVAVTLVIIAASREK